MAYFDVRFYILCSLTQAWYVLNELEIAPEIIFGDVFRRTYQIVALRRELSELRRIKGCSVFYL